MTTYPAPKTCEWTRCAKSFHPLSRLARFCSERCRYLARDRRRAKEGARRHNPQRTRTKPEERDLGPAWPLLLPPEVGQRERQKLEARVLQAWRDGVGSEGLLERFGAVALHILATSGVHRPRTGGPKLPAGLPL